MPPEETRFIESRAPNQRDWLDPDWREHAPFYQAIRQAADDDPVPALILADWWEDQGHWEQAALVRLRVESESLPATNPRHHEARVQADCRERVIMSRTTWRTGEEWPSRGAEDVPPGFRLATRGLVARWRHGLPDMIFWEGATHPPNLIQDAIDLAPLTGLNLFWCDRSRVSELQRLSWPIPPRRLWIRLGDFESNGGTLLTQLLDAWNAHDSLVELSLPVETLLGPNESADLLLVRLPRRLKRLHLTSTASHLDDQARPLGDAGLARLIDWDGLERLETLALTHQRLTDRSALRLALAPALKGLQHLDLSANLIGNRGVQALSTSGYLRGLRTLKLAGNALGNAAARSIGSSHVLRNLQELDLSSNHLGDSGLQFLLSSEFLAELSVLEVGGNRIELKLGGVAGWDRFDDGPRIQKLNLCYNPVDAERGLPRIFETPALQDLVIGEVRGLDLASLPEAWLRSRRWTRLRRLDARNARLPDDLARAWMAACLGQLDVIQGSVVEASWLGAPSF